MSALETVPEDDIQERYDPLKPNEWDAYMAHKGRRPEARENDDWREEPPRKVQATGAGGAISIFAERPTWPKKSPLASHPTPVLLLLNMAGPGPLDEGLEADTATECARFGKVRRCVAKQYPGALEEEVTRIYVRFTDVGSSDKAFEHMNGRFFDGRKIRAVFYDERAFEVEFQ